MSATIATTMRLRHRSIVISPCQDSVLPPYKTIRTGLRRTTEALARELAQPGGATPAWSDVEWRLACAAAAAHGVSPLLWKHSGWVHPGWRQFLASQHEHVEVRHRGIERLLELLDIRARAAGLAMVPLKGVALHALGIYAPGDRPMADIDLLIDGGDIGSATRLLHDLGYVSSFDHWRHRVFKPAEGRPPKVLGEHRDIPVNIELHSHIRERLPRSVVDITNWILPRAAVPGLNAYPSRGALLAHLLLHAAGNLCGRSLRLMHLHDIAMLARSMRPADWDEFRNADACWWALPPLRMVARYYGDTAPADVLAGFADGCPRLLRMVSGRQSLADVSCSDLWLHALPGVEWTQGPVEIARFIAERAWPSAEKVRERSNMVRTQLWLQDQDWVTAAQSRRILTWLTRRVPRMDIMFVVRAAFQPLPPRSDDGASRHFDHPRSDESGYLGDTAPVRYCVTSRPPRP